MRTAEEILNCNSIFPLKYPITSKEDIIKIINEARREAIGECADLAMRMVNANAFDKHKILSFKKDLN